MKRKEIDSATEAILDKAREALEPIEYDTKYPAYFIKMNDVDMGGEDFCSDCIQHALTVARREHKEQRAAIKTMFANTIKTRKWKGKKIEASITEAQLLKEMRHRLRKIPANAKFTTEGHDPDFGGGLTYWKTCEDCGEIFSCEFNPDGQTMDYLEEIEMKDLSHRDKWILDSALRYYQYVEPDLQPRLLKIAENIIAHHPQPATA